jgi:hypothetical protein
MKALIEYFWNATILEFVFGVVVAAIAVAVMVAIVMAIVADEKPGSRK